MTKHASLLFAAVTAALAIGNVATFVYYQNLTAAEPGHRELAYYQLRIHESNTLAGVSERHPSLQIARSSCRGPDSISRSRTAR